MFYSLACNMQPCSNLTCKWEERLSKNRRAVNCGAKERGEGGRALSYSEGRMKEGARFMCRENRSAVSILRPLAVVLCPRKNKNYRPAWAKDWALGGMNAAS